MEKCDVIIPVYKSPEWVSLCVYSVIKNTDDKVLNKIYLINDCDDELTKNCLKNLKTKYKEKIEVLQNEKNLGFIESTNRGIKESTSDYVLLLNTDCILTKSAIEKMINNIKTDSSIGMVCPISSNAANLTLEMFPGFNYSDMNKLLESKFFGKLFDACTVVGNCLLITRQCIENVGYLDTSYGLGYGEETDYQFKAMSKGFKAKVSIDTYVYHKSEASFGVSKEKQERLNKNRELFFSRWGEEYKKEMNKYKKNDPIKFIQSNLTEDDKTPQIDTAFYLNAIVQNAGGVHVVTDIVNYLAINGERINIIYDMYGAYKEIMLFNPIASDKIKDIKLKRVIATSWLSVFPAHKFAHEKEGKLINFVQGYETLFDNGVNYGLVETSYKLSDSILTISKYLKNELKTNFNIDSYLINNGINYNLLHKEREIREPKTITFILRNNVMKSDWLLLDIIKKLDNRIKGFTINVVHMSKSIKFPKVNNNRLIKHLGPLSRNEIYSILQSSDIYVDASLNEGFGLTPLESMASGNVPIVSNSFGINDFIVDEKNGIIINEVNNSDKYVEKIEELIKKPQKFNELRSECLNSSSNFDIDNTIDKYIDYFKNPSFKKTASQFDEEEKSNIEKMIKDTCSTTSKKRKAYYLAKLIPNSTKNKIKKIITNLYNSYNH